MANQLDQIVDVQISRVDTPISRTGFGTPMILGTHKNFNERAKTYYDLDSMINDGFKTTDPEYIGVESYFSQSPRVEFVEVGRRDVDDVTITVTTAVDSTDYTTTVDGDEFVINSGGSATPESIAAALVADLTDTLSGVTDAVYSGENFDASAQNLGAVDVKFNPDGSKMYILDFDTKSVYAYNLGTNYDVSTAVYGSETFSTASEDGTPSSISFNDDGSKIYVTGIINSTVFTYDLTINYVISSPTYVGAEDFDVSTQDSAPVGIAFNAAGTKMMVLGDTTDAVYGYDLASAFDPSTATLGESFSVTQESNLTGLGFNAGGTKMYITGTTNDKLYQYDLGTGFDVSTAVYSGDALDVSAQSGSPMGPAFNADYSKVFIISNSTDTVYAYDVPPAAVTATDNLNGTYTLAAVVSGIPYTLSVDGNQTISTLVPSDTITNDIVAVRAVSDDWYALTETRYDTTDVLELAGYMETTRRLYFTTSNDTNIIDQTAIADTTSIAYLLKAADYDRTIVNYHEQQTKFECGWLGVCLPTDPGSITWAYKTIKGVTPSTLNTNQVPNALDKNCNVYNTVAGRNITREGKVSSGEWIDIMRGSDWLHARIQENIFTLLVNSPKVAYTSGGITTIDSYLKSTLSQAVTENFLSAYTTSVPDINSIDPNDKINRVLKNVTFIGILAGAIQKVEIRGQLTPDGSLITQIV